MTDETLKTRLVPKNGAIVPLNEFIKTSDMEYAEKGHSSIGISELLDAEVISVEAHQKRKNDYRLGSLALKVKDGRVIRLFSESMGTLELDLFEGDTGDNTIPE